MAASGGQVALNMSDYVEALQHFRNLKANAEPTHFSLIKNNLKRSKPIVLNEAKRKRIDEVDDASSHLLVSMNGCNSCSICPYKISAENIAITIRH